MRNKLKENKISLPLDVTVASQFPELAVRVQIPRGQFSRKELLMMPRLLQDDDWERAFRVLLEPVPPTHVRDVPRDELRKEAEERRAVFGNKDNTLIIYKFTCAHCGFRNAHPEIEILPEKGRCRHCHQETQITQGGYTYFIIAEKSSDTKEQILLKIKEIIKEF